MVVNRLFIAITTDHPEENIMKTLRLFTLVLSLALSASIYAADKPQMGADMHAAKGVPCAACHGDNPMKNDLPTETQCVVCHNKAALIEKTKDVKPMNPHNAPHNNDCAACHNSMSRRSTTVISAITLISRLNKGRPYEENYVDS